VGRDGVATDLHMNLNWYLNDIMPPEGPESSEAFIPKRLDIKDNGKNITVTTVKSIIVRPWAILSYDSFKDASAWSMVPCCCLKSKRLPSY
jgi:hypothetical protein